MMRALVFKTFLLWIVSALSTIFIIGCAGKTKQDDSLNVVATAAKPATYEEIQKQYKSGMAALEQSIKMRPRRDKFEIQILSEYMIYWQKLLWAELRRDNKIIAKTDGIKDNGVLVLYSPGHPILKTPGPTLSTSPGSEFPAVLIRPDRISEFWATAFLMHELSHLGQMAQGRELSSGLTELLAYRLEKLVINQMTSNRLDEQLDKALDNLKIQNQLQFLNTLDKNRVALQAESLTALKDISPSVALSTQEEEMKRGFMVMAMALRLYERQGLISAENDVVLSKMIEETLARVSKF